MRFRSSDRSLAVRLEQAESANGVAMAKAVAGALPTSAFEAFAGGTAIFAGVDSPMTHALGIGLNGHVPEQELERMEEFFRSRGSACLIDLCTLADLSVIHFVQTRPYRTIEFNNVMARKIGPEERWVPQRDIRAVAPDEMTEWTRVIGEGFTDGGQVSDELVALMSATLSQSQCFAVEVGDELRGGAAMGIQNGTALFYGDSILPAARGRGYQQALLQTRLAAAQVQGCDLAMASVIPGSGSHRNYERAGFQLIYMRVNMVRDFAVVPER